MGGRERTYSRLDEKRSGVLGWGWDVLPLGRHPLICQPTLPKLRYIEQAPISWHAASIVSFRWPTTVHPAFSAKTFNFSLCSKLIRVLVLFDLWLLRSESFREIPMQLCIPQPPEKFISCGPPVPQGWRERGGGNDMALFSTVLTGLTSDESGPSWEAATAWRGGEVPADLLLSLSRELAVWRVLRGFCNNVRHSAVESIICMSNRIPIVLISVNYILIGNLRTFVYTLVSWQCWNLYLSCIPPVRHGRHGMWVSCHLYWTWSVTVYLDKDVLRTSSLYIEGLKFSKTGFDGIFDSKDPKFF